MAQPGGAEPSVAAVVDDGFASDVARYSYAIGVEIGSSFTTQDIEIDVEAMREALGASYAGDPLRQTQEQSLAAMSSFEAMMGGREAAEAAEASAANREAGAVFLAENGAREGVVTTESGLQYEILEAGDGALAQGFDSVRLHYTGKLIDGTTFDSTGERGSTVFKLQEVIPGFSEGLRLLPMGTKANLFMPAELGYGDFPQGPGGPGSTLIFEVQLVSIDTPPEQPTLADQIEQVQERMEEDLRRIREQGEMDIAGLEAEMKEEAAEAAAVAAAAASVGGEEAPAVERKKDLQYD